MVIIIIIIKIITLTVRSLFLLQLLHVSDDNYFSPNYYDVNKSKDSFYAI